MDDTALNRIHRLSVACLVCACLIFAPQAVAQTLLTAGEIVTGTINASQEERWSFVATAGAMYSILVTASDNTFDPVIRIEDARGRTLIENDDIAYPDDTNALIESFSPGRTGTYTLVVSGYGNSSGSYDIALNHGYGRITETDDFSNPQNWTLPSQDGTGEFVDEQLRLSVEQIDSYAVGTHRRIELDTPFHASIEIDIVNNRSGWRAGLGIQNNRGLLDVSIDHRGFSRVNLVAGRETRILRDWSSHPAIVPDKRQFTLGLSVREGELDIFYDGQLVGSAADAAITGGSPVVIGGTANAVGTLTTASFDNLIVTQPYVLQSANNIPQQIVVADAMTTMRELKRRFTLPAGGEMVLNVPESFAQNVEAGVSRFPLARGARYANFVFAATVSIPERIGILSGCGLVVRDTGNADMYGLAYVDSGGGSGLAFRDEDSFPQALFRDDLPIQGGTYNLLVIANGSQLHYYIDGHFVGTITSPSNSGGIGEAVINHSEINTTCQFNDVWLWRWE